MPKFHVYLLSAAHGFHITSSSIDHLVANNQKDFVELLASSFSNDSLAIKLSDEKQQSYSNELQWIQFVAKAWKISTPTPSIDEVRNALNCNTSLKPGSVDAIVSALEASVAAADYPKGNAAIYRQVTILFSDSFQRRLPRLHDNSCKHGHVLAIFPCCPLIDVEQDDQLLLEGGNSAAVESV